MISSYSPTAPLFQPATTDVVASEEGSAARRWKSSPIGTLSFLTSSFFFCTLTQACVDTKFWKKLTSECQNSMSLLTNKTWRGSTLTDWNVLIILLPCKKTWEHSLKTRLGRISTLICGQSTHLPYKAAVIVVPDWHWILSHWRENSDKILVPGFLNPSMSGTQG